MTPEGRIKALFNRRFKEHLEPLGAYKFMPVQNGMGAPALDYYICLRGRFFAVETKRSAKHDLTDRQKETRDRIQTAGGTVFRVYDDASVREAIFNMITAER